MLEVCWVTDSVDITLCKAGSNQLPDHVNIDTNIQITTQLSK